jgi:hypothetical protein
MWQNFLFTFGGFELDIIAIYNNEQSRRRAHLTAGFFFLAICFD